MKTPHITLIVTAAVLFAGLGGCAVQQTPVQLAELQSAPQAPTRSLAQEAAFRLDTGYARSLKSGSNWRLAGALPQGQVYRPVNDVFTLEGKNVHEAYLVLRDDVLVGFYLPVEHSFSPLQPPVPLRFTQ
jgi:hypothetical protein